MADDSHMRKVPLLALAFCVLALTVVCLYDLDYGFYLAIGREIRANGIPAREFYLPLLEDRAFASPFLLSALLIEGAWSLAGAAGLILLKAICITGGLLCFALAALRRGVEPWIAALVAGIVACAVSMRFVERPGFFSILLMGVLFLVLVGEEKKETEHCLSWPLVACITAGFAVWSFLHAEWYVGYLLLGALVLGLRAPMARTVALLVAVPAVVFSVFALVHPGGIKVLLWPLGFLFAQGSVVVPQEYTPAVWRVMWPAIPVLCAGAVVGGWLVKRGRWGEGVLLVVLVLLCIKLPRLALPAALIAIPSLAECAAALLSERWRASQRLAVGACAVLVLAGTLVTWLTPWRSLGLGIDATINTRPIGDWMTRVDPGAGPLLADFGWSSALLAHPAVVQHGVVMDGRGEVYTTEYYEDFYLPLLDPSRPDWARRLHDSTAAFYFQPHLDGGRDLAGAFRGAGWRLATWNDAGRLFVRRDLLTPEEALRFDPMELEALATADRDTIRAAEEEIAAQCARLRKQGHTAARGLIAVARLRLALEDVDGAALALEQAREDGAGGRSYWETVLALRVMQEDLSGAEAARRRLK